MNQFLQKSFHLFKNNDPSMKICLVLGNETCDLDSAVASIVYSYFLHHKLAESAITLPVFNIPHHEVELKTEVTYFLKENGINLNCILTKDNLDLKKLQETNRLELILVDHHVLPLSHETLKKSVVEVIDHRPQDPAWVWKNSINETVGSCCTLITEKFVKNSDELLSKEICKLLLGPIILDTANLSAERATARDHKAVTFLTEKLRFFLHQNLTDAKSDINGLKTMQVFRKDLKIIGGIPIIGLPQLVQQFIPRREDFYDVLKEFQTLYNNTPVIVLLGVNLKSIQRDLAIYGTNEHLVTLLVNHLLKSNLSLKELPNHENNHLRLFDQTNIKATRKQIGPLISHVTDGMPEIAKCRLG